MLDTVRSTVDKADEAALTKQEEGVHVAVQWAQEKIDNFLLEIEWVIPILDLRPPPSMRQMETDSLLWQPQKRIQRS